MWPLSMKNNMKTPRTHHNEKRGHILLSLWISMASLMFCRDIAVWPLFTFLLIKMEANLNDLQVYGLFQWNNIKTPQTHNGEKRGHILLSLWIIMASLMFCRYIANGLFSNFYQCGGSFEWSYRFTASFNKITWKRCKRINDHDEKEAVYCFLYELSWPLWCVADISLYGLFSHFYYTLFFL